MPGSVDRPPDLVRDLRGMKARLHELNNAVPSLPVVTVVVSAVQSIPTGSVTNVTFSLVETDTGGAWDAGTPTLLTIPRTAVYMVSGFAMFDTSSSGERQMLVSTSTHGAFIGSDGKAVTNQWRGSASAPILLTEGTTVTMSVYQNTGSALDLEIGRLGLTWLGKASEA